MRLPYARLSAYYFCYFAFIGAFSPYFGLYLQSLSFSAWDIGLLMSQMQLMRLVGPYLWGWLADRRQVSRVGIVRLAGGVSLLGFLAFFGTTSLLPMLLAMALMAFFWSAALPLMETLTFDHLGARAAEYSRIRVWGSIGFIVTVLAAGAMLDRVAARGVLWLCTVILAGILLCALCLPEAPCGHPARRSAALGRVCAAPRVRALFAACLAMSAAHGAYYIFYSIHLAEQGYGKTAVGSLWALGVLAEIGVFMGMARLMRLFGLQSLLLASFAAAVLRFLLMGWCAASLPLMIFAQLLHGLTFGAQHAAAIGAVHRWFPPEARARGQALYSSLSFGAGGLLGGLASGALWEALGAGWTFTLSAASAFFGGVLVWRWVKDDADDAAEDASLSGVSSCRSPRA